MSVFVHKGKTSDVKFFVKSTDERIWLKTAEELKGLAASEKEGFEEYHVALQPLSWGEACSLQSRSMTSDPMTAQRVFDTDNYVRMKLHSVIADWSFTDTDKDGNEKKVEVSSDSIDMLHPAVADFILKEYRKRFELSEEDRKNF